MAVGLVILINLFGLISGGVALLCGAGFLTSLAVAAITGTVGGLCCVGALLAAAMKQIHSIHLAEAELVSD